MTLQERLSFYRRKSGRSQEEVAAALNVTRQAVSKWETGRAAPDLDTLARLAALYHVSLSALTREEPQMEALPFDSLRWSSEHSMVRPKSIRSLRRLAVVFLLLGAIAALPGLWRWMELGLYVLPLLAPSVLFFLLAGICRAAGNGLDELFMEMQERDEDMERRFRLLREQLRKFTNT